MIIRSYFKYGTIYREVLKTPKIDICSLYALFKKDRILVHKWVAALVDVVEDSVPGALHECPYSVSLSLHILNKH